MKIVIDIDEEVYKNITEKCVINAGMRSGKSLLCALLSAIIKGTPLPKGHGRLIDVDAGLECCTDIYEIKYWDEEVPTIIEADKGDKK